MKEPTTTFAFKRNTDINALPDAKPKQAETVKPPKPAKKKVKKTVKKQKTRAISAYLTEEEYDAFVNKLDGRVASATVRNLILKYIKS